MRTRLCSVMMAVFLVCGLYLPASAAQTGVDLTGKQWQESTRNEKLAFLYGASSVIAIEDIVAERAGKQPSLFVQGWLKAFKDTSWSEIEAQLDAWYASHPGQTGRHVLDVMWQEFLAPAIGR